ncbi:helix-turn-helix domain-containing protein [Geofilum rubicundum]|nr:helix-turn-helix transcriptional regulator [Geofilum rubicundum]
MQILGYSILKTEEYCMNFGEKMTLIRKQKKLSQAELGKRSGINGDIVGKYERNEMKPSIETAKKLADALEVSLDYLVGDGDLKILDKKTLKRLEDIENLPDEDRTNIFYTIDNLIKAAKLKAI